MNRKRIFILTALILTVCLVLSMFAVACKKNNDNGNTDNNTDSTLLFTNGTFASGASDSAVTSPSNWTGSAGSTSSSTSSTYTPSGDSDLTKGVVGTSSSDWKALQKQYSHISVSSPGKGKSSNDNDELNDSKVLMINNRVATSYKYTSQSHSLDTNSYYKLSVDVKTDLDANNSDPLAGAYIYVNGAAYAAWEAINTRNTWQTCTLYIETSEISSGSITVVLSLGIGNGATGHLTKGYAFFDNVVLEKISEAKDDEDETEVFEKAKAEYNDQKVNTLEDRTGVAKYTMKVSDSEFDYASSTTSVPYSPSKYTQVNGFGSGSSAPSSSKELAKGIIDTSTFDDDSVKTSLSSLANAVGGLDKITKLPDSVGTRMLYIQNKLATAFGYRADAQMNFELNKYYKVSVWARTFIEQGSASIRLTDGTNTDTNDYTIAVNTNGDWKQYTFYVMANQFRSTQLKLELWLGYGGSEDTDKHAKGVALFDLTTIEEIDAAAYNGAVDSETNTKINLSTNEDNMIPVDLSTFKVQNPDELNSILAGRSEFKVFDTLTYDFSTDAHFKVNPEKPLASRDNTDALNSTVLAINNFKPTATVISTLTADVIKDETLLDTNLIKILPNKTYAISMFIKTMDISTSQGMTVSLLKYNEKYTEGQEFDESYTTLSSFSNLNSENADESDKKNFNGYTLITFYVLGDQFKDARLGISISIGSGDGTDYSSLVMGYGYVCSMNVEAIPYSQYSSASSSTTVNVVDLTETDTASSNGVSSNGYFKNMDFSATTNLYGSEIFDDNGALKGALALPKNWSINSSSSLTEKTSEDEDAEYTFNNMAGILNLNNQSQLTAFGGIDVDNFYNGEAAKYFNVDDNPTVLAIKKTETLDKLGFTSNSISLSANSYYTFMVWAKANVGNEFTISLKSGSNAAEDKFTRIIGDGKWHNYTLYIATGISSASVTLSLSADTSTNTDSTVFFTGATYSSSINEDVFGNAQDKNEDNLFAQSWLVDSFDDVDSADSISSAKNFSGALIDSDAKSDEDTLTSGVIDKNKTNYFDIDLDVDGEDEAIVNAIFNNEKTDIGDRALVIYNKNATSYGYTSNSASITPGKYYKISVWVLTYKLALNTGRSSDADTNFIPTATITLKANNKTYEFGRKLTSSSTEYDKQRIVNTSTYDDEGKETIGDWTQYSFYIFAEDDIEDTTATLTVSLGFKGKDFYLTGYVFVDNFAVEEIDEESFIARKDVYKEAENGKYFKNESGEYVEIDETHAAPAGATLYNKLTDSEVAEDDNDNNSVLKDENAVANNYRIVFTSDDSKAEPEEETQATTAKKKDPLVWLYVSIGAVSGIIVVIVVIFLIKKFIPKKKKKLIKNSKNKKTSNSSKRDQFGK